MDKLRLLSTIELKRRLKERGLSRGCRVKEDLVKRLYKAQVTENSKSSEEYFTGASSENSSAGGDSETVIDSTSSVAEEESLLEGPSSYLQGQISGTLNQEKAEDQVTSFIVMNNAQEDTELETKIKGTTQTNSFVFRDIEDSLESFDGESGKDVKSWLKEFEDIAAVCSWNDIQKYLYARRLLRGAAKLAVEASVGLHSWKSLKDYLASEFGIPLPGVNVHRALEARKKNSSETLLQYFYYMKHLASRGDIDDTSLIVHIIEGIPDKASNKIIL